MRRVGAIAFILLVAVSLSAYSCMTYSGSDGGELDENANIEHELEYVNSEHDFEYDDDCFIHCDAVYVPYVIFTFRIADTGEPYCGPAVVTYSYDDKGPYDVHCDCSNGEMMSYGYSHPCHVNPPYGFAMVTAEVEGFKKYSAEIFMPCECNPRIPVQVELVPL